METARLPLQHISSLKQNKILKPTCLRKGGDDTLPEMEILSSTQNPRYFPLQKYAVFLEIDSVNLKHEKQTLEYHIQFMKKDLMELNSEKPQKN